MATMTNPTGGPPIQLVATVDPATGSAVDTTLPADVNITQIGGQTLVADDAAAGTTVPLPIGGMYSNILPVTYADGDRTLLRTNQGGVLLTQLAGINHTAGNGVAFSSFIAPASALAGAGIGTARGPIIVAGYISNGTTADLLVKANATSRIASAAATVNATSAKASAGNVFRAIGHNAKASVVYLKIYNKASAPTVGTDVPVLTIPLAASASFNVDIGGANGFYLGTGIAYGFTTDAADAGTTALSAGDILGFTLSYS